MEFKGNIMKTWQVIKSILPGSPKSRPNNEMKIDGISTTNKKK